MPSAPAFGTGLPGIQQIPSRAKPWEREIDGAKILDAGRAAEAAGFAWITCSDHPAVPVSRAQAMGPTWFDAGSTLAFVAGVTTRIRLMPHVLVLPYRHPLVVAKQYGTLDYLSGGRVIMGVGSGHVKAEFKTLGADFEARGKVTDEYMRALAAAWEHDVGQFDGEFVTVRDMMVWPRPVQKPRPPFWVGGNSNAAVKRAARFGDGWIPWELSPEDFASKAAYARHLRHDAGRSETFTLVAPLSVAADAVADPVLRDITRWREAGATAFHVGLAADSWPQYLDRLAWFGRAVIARASSNDRYAVARNVEVKARLAGLDLARRAAERIGARFEWVDEQVDRYYQVGDAGRVKLRTCGRAPAELIRYARPETAGVRASEYEVLPVRDAEAHACLVPKTPPVVVVRKTRELWLLDNVRIHLDTVDGLGTFLELEAVVGPSHDEARCHAQVDALLPAFGVTERDCVRASYSDLLQA